MKQWFAEMKNFLCLWLGQTASQLGSRMTSLALVIYSFTEEGTVMSVALLSLSAYLPEILFTFLGGSVADRWNRKMLMLSSDLIAALGTLTILVLYRLNLLVTWHVYAVNLVVGMMNAFQAPAANAALSQIVPPRHYARASALQSLSNALNTMAAPALAAAVVGFGGLEWVLAIDLDTFAFCTLILLFFVRIPAIEHLSEKAARGGTVEGFRFLRNECPALLRLILFFSVVNLLASMSGNGLMPAMVLARTGGDELSMGLVSSCIGLGALLGSIAATLLPRPKHPLRIVFLCTAFSFALCDLLWGLGRSVPVWAFAAAAGNFPLPMLNANLTAVMRSQIPADRQGRVFAAQGTLQFCSIPLGYLLGGLLCDYVTEPLMQSSGWFARMFTPLTGSGSGAGIAVLFLLTGICGTLLSLAQLRKREYDSLEKT